MSWMEPVSCLYFMSQVHKDFIIKYIEKTSYQRLQISSDETFIEYKLTIFNEL